MQRLPLVMLLIVVLNFNYFSQQNALQTLSINAKPIFNNSSYFFAIKGKPFMNRFNIKSVNPLTVVASNLPSGVIFNSTRKLVQGTVATTGIYHYKIKATNSDGSDSLMITLDVRDSLQSPTPPMGWLTWNVFGGNINEALLKQIADAMVSSGMKNAGYTYLIIDDLWTAASRDANGLIQPDPAKFPSGMKALADYVHQKGLKLGIYSDAASTTCAGAIGSYGNEQKDANQFASWGVDFLKYDYCWAPSNMAQATVRYKAMSAALKNTGRKIIYNVCEWGQLTPWIWAGDQAGGHMWRIAWDGRDIWDHGQYDGGHCGVIQVLNIIHGLEYYAGPNKWNDSDMLMAGLYGTGQSSSNAGANGMSLTEYQSQFSLWCLFSTPLSTSFDIRNIDQNTKNILLNTEAISINQDPLGQQASRIITTANYSIYAKDLADGSKAVGLLNLSAQNINITVNWNDLYIAGNHSIRDVWKKQDVGSSNNSFTASVKAHETVLLRISPNNNLSATFSANHTSVCPGNSVAFADQSTGNPTSWNWTFTGGIPATSTQQNPVVVYNSAGTYPVSLSVSNSQGSNSTTQTAYITVSSSAPFSVAATVASQSSFYPGEDASNVFDNDINTIWHNDWGNNTPLPHTLVFNLGSAYDLQGFDFLNRQNNSNGYPKDVEISTSTDNISWSSPTTVTLGNTNTWQSVNFTGTNAKYLKLKVISTISGSSVCSIAEIKLRGCPSNTTGIISEPATEADLQVYPNPSNGSFDININSSKIENGIILITDVLGREVFRDQLNSKTYSKKLHLNEKGVYLITLVCGNEKLSRRIIIE